LVDGGGTRGVSGPFAAIIHVIYLRKGNVDLILDIDFFLCIIFVFTVSSVCDVVHNGVFLFASL
jgi:hypothetical protein